MTHIYRDNDHIVDQPSSKDLEARISKLETEAKEPPVPVKEVKNLNWIKNIDLDRPTFRALLLLLIFFLIIRFFFGFGMLNILEAIGKVLLAVWYNVLDWLYAGVDTISGLLQGTTETNPSRRF